MALKKSGVILVAEGYNEYMKKMRDINKAHQDAFAKSTSTRGITETGKKLSGLNSVLGDAISGFTNMGPIIGRLTGAFTALAPAIAAVQFADWISGTAQLALNVETLDISLRTMAEASGYSAEQVDFAIASLKEQGITTEAAIKALQRLTRAEISWTEATELAQIAQGAAVGTNMTSSEAYERLVLGIQKMEPELLDELGITLRREVAYKLMAQQLGKNTKELTDAEKKQAILNQIHEQSTVVMHVYEAAMGTAGKQQKSLARLQEETALNVGQLTKHFAAAGITMQTEFYKGAQDATKGLALWGPVLEQSLGGLGKLQTMLGELSQGGGVAGGALGGFGGLVKGLFPIIGALDSISKAFQNAGPALQTYARVFVDGTTMMAAAFITLKHEIVTDAQEIADVWRKLTSRDFQGAWEQATSVMSRRGEAFTGNFTKVFSAMMDANHKKFPDLYKAWADVGKAAEVSLENTQEGLTETTRDVEALTKALEKQVSVLEATQNAFQQAKKIQETYDKAVKQAAETRDKELAEAQEQFLADQAEMEARHQQEILDFDSETAEERLRMIDDYNRESARAREQFNRDQLQQEQTFNLQRNQEQERFQQQQLQSLQRHQLSMEQARRRQGVNERRLRAEGDVLALMQAQEDFSLSQTEAQENFDLETQQAQEQFNLQQQLQQEQFNMQQELARENFEYMERLRQDDFRRQLEEFDAQKAEEREKILATQQQERDDLLAHYEEQKAQILANYEEQMAMAEEQKQQQLEALGDSLKEQGELTEEGMREIAEKISEVFGEEGAGDALIRGWSERSQNEFNVLVDAIGEQIDELHSQIEALDAAGGEITNASRGSSNFPGRPGGPGVRSPRRGMREGGSGVVTGPAVFEVEPGQREAFMFAPLPPGWVGGTLDVRMSGGFDITGGEAAGAQAVDKALQSMTKAFEAAADKLARRSGK